ncbi:MAG: nucleoside diphosphate kinase regulator [Gammaproteobacteria bacterium]|nr:nucleoside diphosphate kinase regulator [Gammaproteobacteria bacterium]
MNEKPKLILSSLDYDRLEALLEALPAEGFPGRDALELELERADIVEPSTMPPNVVTMNSTVRFAIDSTGEEFTLTLVYPKDIDGNAGRISILAPVGSALLGLATGDHIEWPRPGGGMMKVRIVEVIYQPERAGEFHR